VLGTCAARVLRPGAAQQGADAIEAVERIDALFAIERDINGKPPPERRRIRNEHSRLLVTELEKWLRQQRAKLSAGNQVAKAIAYSLNCWSGLTRFLDDARLRAQGIEQL
jgi:transposase